MARSVNKVTLLETLEKIRDSIHSRRNNGRQSNPCNQRPPERCASNCRTALNGITSSPSRALPKSCATTSRRAQNFTLRVKSRPAAGRQRIGQKRYRTEIIVNDLVLLTSRDDSSGGGQGGYTRSSASSNANGFDQRSSPHQQRLRHSRKSRTTTFHFSSVSRRPQGRSGCRGIVARLYHSRSEVWAVHHHFRHGLDRRARAEAVRMECPNDLRSWHRSRTIARGPRTTCTKSPVHMLQERCLHIAAVSSE